MVRILSYYFKLLRYAATAKPRTFHILWNNKVLHFDRTLLMFYYRLLGKRLVLTVHNVNAAKRDNRDSAFNRFTLRIQYFFFQAEDGIRDGTVTGVQTCALPI